MYKFIEIVIVLFLKNRIPPKKKNETQSKIDNKNCSCKGYKLCGITAYSNNSMLHNKGITNNGLRIFLSNQYPKKENKKNINDNIVNSMFLEILD
ncbi:hypothetical protein CAPN006_07250 [Capnocytophaga canimorsus]|nr:hypothetical protein CAPN006_07250 [Capnocytophaga canimorsus]